MTERISKDRKIVEKKRKTPEEKGIVLIMLLRDEHSDVLLIPESAIDSETSEMLVKANEEGLSIPLVKKLDKYEEDYCVTQGDCFVSGTIIKKIYKFHCISY